MFSPSHNSCPGSSLKATLWASGLLALILFCASLTEQAVQQGRFLTNSPGTLSLDRRITVDARGEAGLLWPVRVLSWVVSPESSCNTSYSAIFITELSSHSQNAISVAAARTAPHRRLAVDSRVSLACPLGTRVVEAGTQSRLLTATDCSALAVLYHCQSDSRHLLLSMLLVWDSTSAGWTPPNASNATMLLRSSSPLTAPALVYYDVEDSEDRPLGSSVAFLLLRPSRDGKAGQEGGRLLRLALGRATGNSGVSIDVFALPWLPPTHRHAVKGMCYDREGNLGALVGVDDARRQSVFHLFSLLPAQRDGTALLLSETATEFFPENEPALLATCGLSQRLTFARCRIHREDPAVTGAPSQWAVRLVAMAHAAVHSTRPGRGGAEWVPCGTALFEATVAQDTAGATPIASALRRAGGLLHTNVTTIRWPSKVQPAASQRRLASRRCRYLQNAWWERPFSSSISHVSCALLGLSFADLTLFTMTALPLCFVATAVFLVVTHFP